MRPTGVLRFLLVCSAAGLLALSSHSGVLASHSQQLGRPAILPPRGLERWEPHVPGAELWAQRYDGGHDFANALGVSPDGSKVFVTGQSGGLNWRAYTTIAYEASTGTPLWIQRYGALPDKNIAYDLGVSPDGSRVFVTGGADGQFGTVAYDASSGAQVWLGLNAGVTAFSLAVSPDGTQVFVTGISQNRFATIAYEASSGTTQWIRFDESGRARAVDVSPDGTRVFVTGTSGEDYATIAYDASSGVVLWSSRYEGWPGRETEATSMGVSPDGSRVFITGGIGRPSGVEYGTVAYNAATGAAVWVRHYGGGLHCCVRHIATSLGVSSDGSKIFVTGYTTLAYGASTGTTLWIERYTGITPGGDGLDSATSLAVSPDGTRLFITGESGGSYVTIGIQASSGAPEWLSRFEGFGGEATSIGVHPGGTSVFITGSLFVEPPFEDYVTVAYSTR